MARQDMDSTPIFDQLLREMTEGAKPAVPNTEPEGAEPVGAAQPRRRHRSE
ncbi:hypothetical protein [Actinophytocola sp.]|uniref:hypothetical protein n=1 Tax=Actinophytocola sp. TaxID=1872138 RepID=UPI002D7EB785|nr:hypothetical protein [Actinophytocola sp.]HET9141356.1 hypothetical protein [Actinophytocola sp.]